jgi:hypothetical protein
LAHLEIEALQHGRSVKRFGNASERQHAAIQRRYTLPYASRNVLPWCVNGGLEG